MTIVNSCSLYNASISAVLSSISITDFVIFDNRSACAKPQASGDGQRKLVLSDPNLSTPLW